MTRDYFGPRTFLGGTILGPLECKTEEQEPRPTAIIVDPNNRFDLETILEDEDCPKPVDINCIRKHYRNN